METQQIALFLSAASVFMVSVASLVGIFALIMTGRFLQRIIFVLVSLSVGVLFGDVFIHILPELYESPEASMTSYFVLSGIVLFFVLEKFLRWGHVHDHHEHVVREFSSRDHSRPVNKALGGIILFADGLHNFIDGVIITASFMVSPELGLATTIAVILHEIPQEIGDFGILLHAGYKKGKALLYNFFSALASFLGWAVTIILGNSIEGFTYIALSIAAGGFIYIAGSDLVPELQKASSVRKSVIQLLAMLAGFALMFALLAFE